MSNIVGTIELAVVPNATNLVPALQRIINQAEKAVKTNPILNPALESKSATTIQKAVKQTSDTTVKANKAVENSYIGVAAGAAGVAAGIFAIKKVAEVVLSTLSGLFDGLEKAAIGFEVLAGVDAGDRLLQSIRQLAKETPFATSTLLKYSQQLLGVGVAASEITPLLENVGDLVASRGGDNQQIERTLYALSQIKAAGRLIGQDALQLQNALIPITQLLAKDLGKSTQDIKEMQRQGLISAQQVFSTLSAAGQEVTGAMEKNTKTIMGAQEVLNDTFIISLQNTKLFSEAYDDVVQSILNVAKFLDSVRVQAIITDWTDALAEMYDAIVPVLGELGGPTLEVFLTLLEAAAPVVSAFATALNTIPDEALTAIVTFFAYAGLAKWIGLFGRSAAVLAGFGSVLGKLGPAMGGVSAKFDKGAKSINKYTEAMKASLTTQRLMSAGAIGAAGAGLLIAGSKVEGTGGDALSIAGYGATGAAIGTAMGGPLGAALGAAAGVGIGGISTYLSNERDEEERRQDEWERIGQMAAARFNIGFEAMYDVDTAGVEASDRVDGQQKTLAAYALLRAAADGQTSITPDVQAAAGLLGVSIPLTDLVSQGSGIDLASARLDSGAGKNARMIDNITTIGVDVDDNFTEVINVTMTQAITDAKALGAILDSDFDDLNSKLQTIFDSQKKIVSSIMSSDLNDVLKINPQLGPGGTSMSMITGDVDLIRKASDHLKSFGITLDDIDPNDIPADLALFFNEIAAGLAESSRNAIEFIDSFTQTKTTLDLLFAADIGEAQIRNDGLKDAQAIKDDISGIGKSVMEGTLDMVKAGDAAISVFEKATGMASILGGTQEEIIIATDQIIHDSLSGLQVAMKLTDTEFKAWLGTLELLDVAELATAQAIDGMNVSLEDFASMTGFSDDKILELLGDLEKLPTGIEMYITADVSQALLALLEVQKAIDALSSNANLGSSGTQGTEAFDAMLGSEKTNTQIIEDALKNIGQGIATAASPSKGGSGKSAADKAAEEALAAAEKLAAANLAATETLAGALETASQQILDAANEWKSSLKERVQYERSVSVARATKNAERQIGDLTFLNEGIASLTSRGLTDAAISGLGIDSIEDVKQVKKLLGASDEELKTLSESVTTRDSLANQIAENRGVEQTKRTIILAIVEAATILGLDIDKNRAAQIQAEFNITTETDADNVAVSILDMLTNGAVSR